MRAEREETGDSDLRNKDGPFFSWLFKEEEKQ